MKNTPGNQVLSKLASTQAALAAGGVAAGNLNCTEPDVSNLAKNLLVVDRSNRKGQDGAESPS